MQSKAKTAGGSYDAFKDYKGKRYTGMKVGRGHKWDYAAGEWNEKKITPDEWEFRYAVPKRRRGKAPEGSGVPVGSEYHWYILADVDYEKEDPISTIRDLTAGIGVDRAIDAVGVDANAAHSGPAAKQSKASKEVFEHDLKAVAPKINPEGENWHPGDAPSQVLLWAVDALAKAGTLSIIGVYPDTAMTFPIGKAMNKNLTLKMGNCSHRRFMPELIEMVRMHRIDPTVVLTHKGPLVTALEAYKAFDRREAGWTKVELKPSGNGQQPSASRPV